MRTLYVSDLDGTLLNSDVRLSDYTVKTINSLVQEGLLFTYATARSLVSASVVTQGLTTKIPVIAYNGAFIFDASNGDILASEWFNREDVEYVRKIVSDFNVSPLVYTFIDGVEKVVYKESEVNEGVRRYLNNRRGDRRMKPIGKNENLYQGNVFYFTFIGGMEELEPLYNVFRNDRRYRCTFQQDIYNDEYWFEIMPVNATKANAINKLKTLWNCGRIVSFGDAINDVPMFQISDECYAVENAVDELKSIATGVIESNNEDGVAKWLSKYCEKIKPV